MTSASIIVAGAVPLTREIVEALCSRGADVLIMAEAHQREDVLRDLRRCGARLHAGSACSAAELVEAGIDSASVLVLTDDNDTANVDAILVARRIRGDLPIVARIFDPALRRYLRETVPNLTILSMSGIASPRIVELTLAEVERRERPQESRRRRSRVRQHSFRIDRVIAGAALLAVLLILVSTVYFEYALDLRWIDALYFVWTTVFTVGYGDISLAKASDAAKIAGMLLMLAGASIVAVMYAFFTGWVVAQRVDVLRGRVRVRKHGHIVVAGAGNVGYRVALMLGEKGCSVVVIERDPVGRRVSDLRSAGQQVIVADAIAEETLALANVEECAAALALTDSDATNLELALRIRARDPTLPLVVRLASRELSAHLATRTDAIPISPLSLAANAFVEAAMAAQNEVKQE